MSPSCLNGKGQQQVADSHRALTRRTPVSVVQEKYHPGSSPSVCTDIYILLLCKKTHHPIKDCLMESQQRGFAGRLSAT
eukprot:1140927-Pelagomonas_calceolata.AAC.9